MEEKFAEIILSDAQYEKETENEKDYEYGE